MKNIFLVLMLISVFTLSTCGKEEEEEILPVATSTESIEAPVAEEPEVIQEDIIPQYVDSQQGAFGATDEKILFFYSSSSVTSKKFDAILKSDNRPEVFSDIIKIDFDGESAAKENLSITSANTFVLIDEDGFLIKKVVDIENLNDILTLYE